MAIFTGQVAESRHPPQRNSVVNQGEYRLIRQRPHLGPADYVRRMLTPESVESMASRTWQLENTLSSEFRPQNGGGLFAGRLLAQGSADCSEKHQHQSDPRDDSPSHVALLITENLIYHRICLTQIKLFRFIGFHFVLESR